MDTRSEWRTFANDEGDDPSRVGSAANPLLNGPQLDTVISQRDGGSGAARELNRTHGRVTAVKGERNLLQAYKDISAMSEAIGLPKLIGRSHKDPDFENALCHFVPVCATRETKTRKKKLSWS